MAADVPLIAIVDDDPLFRETLAGNLEDAGYAVRDWESGETFLTDMEAGPRPDLLLLDWKMPGLNGIEVLRRMRAGQLVLPVIFLTVLSDQIFEEAALAGGAVDFVEKSRSFGILDKRIRLILGRHGGGAAPAGGAPPGTGTPGTSTPGTGTLGVGELVLDPAIRRAHWRGRLVELTVGEFAMVEALAAKAGRDVSYRELYDSGRGKGFHAGAGEDGYRTNVRAAVKRIREKFKVIDPAFDQIGNYPGFGYVWQTDGRHGG
jgi:two-component system response regulator ChvI